MTTKFSFYQIYFDARLLGDRDGRENGKAMGRGLNSPSVSHPRSSSDPDSPCKAEMLGTGRGTGGASRSVSSQKVSISPLPCQRKPA